MSRNIYKEAERKIEDRLRNGGLNNKIKIGGKVFVLGDVNSNVVTEKEGGTDVYNPKIITVTLEYINKEK